jgi:hypothetical protein
MQVAYHSDAALRGSAAWLTVTMLATTVSESDYAVYGFIAAFVALHAQLIVWLFVVPLHFGVFGDLCARLRRLGSDVWDVLQHFLRTTNFCSQVLLGLLALNLVCVTALWIYYHVKLIEVIRAASALLWQFMFNLRDSAALITGVHRWLRSTLLIHVTHALAHGWQEEVRSIRNGDFFGGIVVPTIYSIILFLAAKTFGVLSTGVMRKLIDRCKVTKRD